MFDLDAAYDQAHLCLARFDEPQGGRQERKRTVIVPIGVCRAECSWRSALGVVSLAEDGALLFLDRVVFQFQRVVLSRVDGLLFTDHGARGIQGRSGAAGVRVLDGSECT